MLVVVWEYRARPERVEEFESFYRPDGPWVELFRRSPAFISTTLMKDLRDPLRFMVADRWTSERLYEEFKREFAGPYDELTARGRRLHDREAEVGRFDFLD
jgi:hypothetical protein